MSDLGKALRVFLHPESPAWVLRQPSSLFYAVSARVLNAGLRARQRFTRNSAAHCIVCGWSGPRFGYSAAVTIARLGADENCLQCGSNPRTRVLVSLLAERIDLDARERTIVDVGAAACTRRFFARHPKVRYRVVDRFKHADVQSDATSIDLPDASADVVVSCHVIEHLDDARAAIRELHRILRDDGVGLIAVPQTRGLATSRKTGQKIMSGYGHVWEFGDDFAGLLGEAGFEVSTVNRSITDHEGWLPYHFVTKRGQGARGTAT